ncbi:MAG: VWA domain-containing protein [Alphaproteobacteria bacterium]|nr:VWA domain-containing protein [Alphaproteobacteria bacterium]
MRRALLALLLLVLPAMVCEVRAQDDDDDEEALELDIEAAPAAAPRMHFKADMPVQFDAVEIQAEVAADGSFSATAGGVQDIAWFREQVTMGQVPEPGTLSPEGLLSEHDLPARKTGPCPRLLCVLGETGLVAIDHRPELAVLSQLGFDSKLTASTYVRPPLNLVALVDQSGSMGGRPIEQIKVSLLVLYRQLRPQDRLSVVVVDDGARVLLEPTPGGDPAPLHRVLPEIGPWGRTRLSAGLSEAIALAERSAQGFDGLTRVISFSDQRPNAGATDPQSFVAQARRAADKGVGLTHVAVGVAADPTFVTEISAVKGGNAYSFPDLERMVEVFRDELDTLAVPLAYDMALEVAPAAGWRLAGVYGIPGAALVWDSTGAARLKIETLFLSTKGGAIYLAFAPEGVSDMPATPPQVGSAVATVGLSYQPVEGAPVLETLGLAVEPGTHRSDGLARGVVLVSEIEALLAATRAWHAGDPAGALEALTPTFRRLEANGDPELIAELWLVGQLWRVIAAQVPEGAALD